MPARVPLPPTTSLRPSRSLVALSPARVSGWHAAGGERNEPPWRRASGALGVKGGFPLGTPQGFHFKTA
jgi:hypothetical protein